VALEVLAGLRVVEVVQQASQRPPLHLGIIELEVPGERLHDDLGGDAVVHEVRRGYALLHQRERL